MLMELARVFRRPPLLRARDSLKVMLYGSGIDYYALKEHVGRDGAVIHSVDQVNVEKI